MCKYCENEIGQNNYLDAKGSMLVDIYKGGQPSFTLDIEGSDESAEILIDFCPKCGRKLNEEKV